MVDTFGFRPRGMLAPFGFGLPSPQPPDTLPGGNGRGSIPPDFPEDPNVIPVGGRSPRLYCQNRNCGAPTAGIVYPLCEQCNERLKKGDGPYRLEDGSVITIPIPWGGLDR
jgi:hypothetical protein